jgi:hypothetical protein
LRSYFLLLNTTFTHMLQIASYESLKLRPHRFLHSSPSSHVSVRPVLFLFVLFLLFLLYVLFLMFLPEFS